MIDLTAWMPHFLQKLDETFGGRVWFVGLQGSYGRGEARETSDLDLVVILDELSAADICTYGAMLDTLEHRALICGFLAGKREILRWDPSDLFQFYHDTTPIRGSLDDVLTGIDEAAVKRAIKLAACNLFHGCVHNMLYEKRDEMLCGLYKAASFAVQAIAYLQTGRYLRRQNELLQVAEADERAIIETFMVLKNGGAVAFDEMSARLFAWAQNWIDKI